MTQQNDTITLGADGEVELVQARQPHKLTPREVLSWLPSSATPEQQDSAIQAHFKPGPIRWSEQPDTLHLPGLPADPVMQGVVLPQLCRDSYFTGRPGFNPDIYGGRQGTGGDPVPYTIARDNIITLILLFCFVIAMIAFAKSQRFLVRQIREFFRPPRREGQTDLTETTGELRVQSFLVFQTCLLQALIYFFHQQQAQHADAYIIDQYLVVALYSATFLGYYLLKFALYWVAGSVFFGRRLNELWLKSLLFLVGAEGVVLYPTVVLQAYFGLDLSMTLTMSVIVSMVFKLLAFYKTYVIFFRQNRQFLQNILYFCTLELMPLAMQWGALGAMSNLLKVNY